MSDCAEVVITSESSGQLCTLSVWDPLTGSQLMSYKGGGVCGSHALSLVGSDYIVGAEMTKPLLHVWPINSSESSHELRTVVPGTVGALAASPDGKLLVAGIAEKFHVWQVEAGKLMCVVTRHFQPVTCIRFFEDGTHFVTGGEDGMVLVWSVSHLIAQEGHLLEPMRSFTDHYLGVKDVYVGHGQSGSRIVSVSIDGSCRVYQFASGKLLLSLIVDAVSLTSVTANVMESSLYLGCSSGEILEVSLIDRPRSIEHHVTEKEKEFVFKGHTKAVTALSSSQDASSLLSGSADETVRLWHIESKQCLRIIQQKGAVINAFLTFLPHQMFADKLKPSVVMHRMQRVNDASNDTFGFETATAQEIEYVEYANGCEDILITCNNDLISSSDVSIESQEIDELRKKNNALFKFASEKLLDECNSKINNPATVIPSLVNIDLVLKEVQEKTINIEPVYQFISSKSLMKKKGKAT